MDKHLKDTYLKEIFKSVSITVKPPLAITSFKQSPVFRGQYFATQNIHFKTSQSVSSSHLPQSSFLLQTGC